MAPRHARNLTSVVGCIFNLLSTKYLRERLSGPRQCLLVLLCSVRSGMDRMGMSGVRLEVAAELGNWIGWKNQKPSTSALCRAIRKLAVTDLERVLETGLQALTQAMPAEHLLIRGLRVVAIDGVHYNLKRTSPLARWVGLPSLGRGKKAHQPQALVVTARCVVTGVTLGQVVMRHDGSERDGARKLVQLLRGQGPMVALLDRGFQSRAIVDVFRQANIDVVLRLCGGKSAWKEAQALLAGEAADVRKPVALKDRNGDRYPANMRLLLGKRVRGGRPRGCRRPQRLILLTTLKRQTWKMEAVIALYLRRWDIETQFREDKRLLGAVKSRATTKDGYLKEILALSIFRLLMALFMAIVVAHSGMDQWNDERGKRLVTTQLIVMAWQMAMAAIRDRTRKGNLDDLAREVARDAVKRRPGRMEPRRCRGVEGVWKGVADRRGR